MTSWRQQLRPASFRGVGFLVESAGGGHGRRYADHEYPGRDQPFFEDMGRKAREYTLEALLPEPDHLGKARALVDACEQPGPGTLVHPWLGELTVVCRECKQSFTTREGGLARLSLTFAEAGEARYPAATVNDVAAVDAAALASKNAVASGFEASFQVADLPGWIGEDAVALVGDATTTIRETVQPIVAAGETAARWGRGLAATAQEAAALVRNPAGLAIRLFAAVDLGNVGGSSSLLQMPFELMGAARALIDAPLAFTFSWRAFLPLADWRLQATDAIPTTTQTRRRQARNREAFTALVRRAAVIEASRAAARETFPTWQEAQAAREGLSERLDREMQLASDPEYRELGRLRTSVVRAVSAKAPVLPRIAAITPANTRPAIVLAQGLWGDNAEGLPERAAEIVVRNRIRHPLFVPAAGLWRC